MSYELDATTATDEPQEESVPKDTSALQPSMGDLYAVVVDMHRMQAEELSILRGFATVFNEGAAQIPAIIDTIQESPLFGMLNGGGGGLLGSLFRR